MEYRKMIEDARNDRMSEVVEATAGLLLKRDVSELTMNDIALECDIGVASLYHYFGTKATLVIKAGCCLWGRVRSMFDGVFESGSFTEKNGCERLCELVKVFKELYVSHKDFLRFVDSFDRYIVSESVSEVSLREYRESIMDFYPIFEEAYKCGIEDGSLRKDIDFNILYLSVTHTMMLLSEKFARGDIFEGENRCAEQELDMLIDMAVKYIRPE